MIFLQFCIYKYFLKVALRALVCLPEEINKNAVEKSKGYPLGNARTICCKLIN